MNMLTINVYSNIALSKLDPKYFEYSILFINLILSLFLYCLLKNIIFKICGLLLLSQPSFPGSRAPQFSLVHYSEFHLFLVL